MGQPIAGLVKGFYYGILNIDEQYFYKKLGNAIAACEETTQVKGIELKELHKVLIALKYDNPEFIYWIPEESELVGDRVFFRYRFSSTEAAEEAVKELRFKRDKIIEHCQKRGDQSQEDQLFGIYRYLVEHVAYAYDELQRPECTKWIYDAEGALLQGKAVCLGIAQAMNYLCEKLRIPSLIITGEAEIDGEVVNHGWNMVRVGGKYYHMDVTCDICEKNSLYKYYHISDDMVKKRDWPRNVYPEAR